MKPFIVLTHSFLPEVMKRELGPHARYRVARTRKELENLIVKADGLISQVTDPIDEALLSRAPQLKVVGNFGVGFNNIDVNACRAKKIRIVNTPDVLTRATAEIAVALLFAAARRIPEGEKLCRSGRFKGWTPTLLLGHELFGRTAVLVGPGRIGKETAKILRGIGMKVVFISRADSASLVRSKLKSADVLSLHLPLNPSTQHWLDSRKLALLPSNCIVINTTRGAVVDEQALIRALQTRRIFSAGLDVFEFEPKIPQALRNLPNVVLLPHLGSATETARDGMARLVTRGVLGILSGKPIANEVK
jgi:glyoxylate reductase